MLKPTRLHHLAWLALVLWLLGNWAGTHGHLCFDGQEPPIAVHMDVMGDHLGHHDDQSHQDADLTPAKPVIAKPGKADLAVLLLTLVTLVLSVQPASVTAPRYQLLIPSKLPHTRPLLRAPPVIA